MVNVDEAKAKLIEYRNILLAEVKEIDATYKKVEAKVDQGMEQVKQSKGTAMILGTALIAVITVSAFFGYAVRVVFE